GPFSTAPRPEFKIVSGGGGLRRLFDETWDGRGWQPIGTADDTAENRTPPLNEPQKVQSSARRKTRLSCSDDEDEHMIVSREAEWRGRWRKREYTVDEVIREEARLHQDVKKIQAEGLKCVLDHLRRENSRLREWESILTSDVERKKKKFMRKFNFVPSFPQDEVAPAATTPAVATSETTDSANESPDGPESVDVAEKGHPAPMEDRSNEEEEEEVEVVEIEEDGPESTNLTYNEPAPMEDRTNEEEEEGVEVEIVEIEDDGPESLGEQGSPAPMEDPTYEEDEEEVEVVEMD
ncbi:hypothetical protein PFISCL1PPCAC_893, partial [Pristionchus fissidentatus]